MIWPFAGASTSYRCLSLDKVEGGKYAGPHIPSAWSHMMPVAFNLAAPIGSLTTVHGVSSCLSLSADAAGDAAAVGGMVTSNFHVIAVKATNAIVAAQIGT